VCEITNRDIVNDYYNLRIYCSDLCYVVGINWQAEINKRLPGTAFHTSALGSYQSMMAREGSCAANLSQVVLNRYPPCDSYLCINDADCTSSVSECGTNACISGGCQEVNEVDGTSCTSDGNSCTTNECLSGACTHTDNTTSCDDSNVCTDDSCDTVTGCVNTNNVASCDDSNACTTEDTCSGGSCVGGSVPDCDDSNVCTDDSCDPATGCVNTPNTVSCDDSNACTTEDTCSAEVCVGGSAPDCDDSNVCTDDSCDPATGCVNTNNTASCDDGNFCTTEDTCSGGSCVGGSAPNCSDDNVCTDDSCGSLYGCLHTYNTASCDDNDACTTEDTCSAGVCVGGPALDCDDSEVCTDDSCNSATGCVNANKADDTSCTDDGIVCTDDVCSSGTCTHPNKADGTSCTDDGNVCTNNICSSGTCTHPVSSYTVVGALRGTGGISQAGKMYVLPNLVAGDYDLSGSLPTDSFTIIGETNSDLGYWGGATVVDFDGNGVNDIAVAGHTLGVHAPTTETGRVYILLNPSSNIDLSDTIPGGTITITGEEYDRLGHGGVTVVDFDGSGGTNDVVIAGHAGEGAGRVYILLNPSGTINLPIGAITITAEGDPSALGRGGVTVADFENDGNTNDVIVAAHLLNSGAGKVYILLNPSVGIVLPTGATITITGEAGSWLGFGGVTVVDFDGGGVTNDVIVAAPHSNSNTGKVYILLNPSGNIVLPAGATTIITGEAADGYLGWGGVTVVDFDGGGVTNDVIVAAPFLNSNTGKVYILLNPSGTINLSSIPVGSTTISGETNSHLGEMGVRVVDFASDGNTNDVVVGAYDFSSATGRVYILQNPSGNIVLPTGATITITGEAASSYLGTSKPSAGSPFCDDGDPCTVTDTCSGGTCAGTPMVCTPSNSCVTSACDAGSCVETNKVVGTSCTSDENECTNDVCFGGECTHFPTSFVYVAAPDFDSMAGRVYMLLNSIGNIDVGVSLPSGSFTITGVVDSWLGRGGGVTVVDFENDGNTNDVVVGAPLFGTNYGGRVYVLLNPSTDVDLATPSTIPSGSFTITGETPAFLESGRLGYGGVTVVDFENDGNTNDVVVSAPTLNSAAGKVYIVLNPTENIDLASPPASTITITGEAGGWLGAGGVTVVDFDGSGGANDIVVAAYAFNSAGRVYILPNPTEDIDLASPPASTITITGVAGSYLGGGGVTVVDFDGSGGTNDVVVAAHGFNTEAGKVYIVLNPTRTIDLALDTITLTGEAGSWLGYGGVTVVDFENDGNTNDVVVGAYGFNNNAGKVYIVLNPTENIDLASPPASTITITGVAGSELGKGGVTVVDFDGSGGTNDVVVGAPASGDNDAGKVFILPNLVAGDAVDLDDSIPSDSITIAGVEISQLGLDGATVVPLCDA
jgi:hypothetical protein